MNSHRLAPIMVRPRKGSALESIREAQVAQGEGMKDLIHRWAEAHVNGNASPETVGISASSAEMNQNPKDSQ